MFPVMMIIVMPMPAMNRYDQTRMTLMMFCALKKPEVPPAVKYKTIRIAITSSARKPSVVSAMPFLSGRHFVYVFHSFYPLSIRLVVRLQGNLEDAFLRSLLSIKLAHNASGVHHINAVAHAKQLWQFRGNHQYGEALFHQSADDAVDFRLRADVLRRG